MPGDVIKKTSAVLAAVLLLFVLIGCKTDEVLILPPMIDGITVSHNAEVINSVVELRTGDLEVITAVVTPDNLENVNFSWSVPANSAEYQRQR